MFNMLVAMTQKHEVHLLLRVNSNYGQKCINSLKEALPSLTIHTCDERVNVVAVDSEQNKSGVKYTLSMRFFDYIRRSMERKIDRRKRKLESRMIISNIERPQSGSRKEEEKKNNILGDLVRSNTTLYNFLPYISPKYIQRVYEVTRMGFDVIQCEFYDTLELCNLLPKESKRIFIHHELRYVRNAIEMELFPEVTPLDTYTYNRYKYDEMASLSEFDVVVTLTETDKELLLKENPKLNVYVSPAIVKYEENPLTFTPLKREMVFVGSSEHFPNCDGLLWYCNEVAPILRERGEEPHLYVTGYWRKEKQDIVKSTGANVEFVGFVEDLHSFINGKLSIVPIRIGSGMRMKILDAVDSASPVLSTSKGCEGLNYIHGEDILISDNAEGFANCIDDIFSDEALQRRLSENSKKKLGQLFDSKRQSEIRMKLYS